MESYNKNILVIDDNIKDLEAGVLSQLGRMGFSVEPQSNPESGYKLASHKYSIIFIDYQFDNSIVYNGTKLIDEIDKKCPLSTLILLTAFGKEYYHDFSTAPLDGYYSKNQDGVKASELDKKLEKCLRESIKRRYQKHPVLDKISTETKLINSKIEILNSLNQLYENSPDAQGWDDKAVAKELGYNNRAALSLKFTVRNTETNELNKEALIFRYIIMNTPTEWKSAKEYYHPLKNLVDYFCI